MLTMILILNFLAFLLITIIGAFFAIDAYQDGDKAGYQLSRVITIFSSLFTFTNLLGFCYLTFSA